ncbi:MAG: RagB/SusD family nutrient uptake outer membrane protein [Salinibacter sp.]
MIALLFVAQGCDSLVERTEPSTSISQETALSNPDAIRGIRASMYDRMHSNALSTDWLLGPSALADNTSFRANQGRHQNLNVFSLRAGVGTGAYNNAYSLINDANLLISGIEEGALPENTAAKFRAEGYFMRALTQHHLVRIFGYDPNGQGGLVSPNSGPGQGFNLGIVLRTEPTVALSDASDKARATVQEVYSQITSDLQNALSIYQGLPEDVKENSRFFPSEAAVQALLARVRLYQRDWDAADAAAQEAIDLAGATLGSDLARPSELTAIFDETTGDNPEAIFEIDTDPATESVGVNQAISAYMSIQWAAQLPTQDLLDLYRDTTDARYQQWYSQCYDEVNQQPFSGCTDVNNKGFELDKYNSEQAVSRYADDYPHLRIAEMYLIQAEARLNMNGPQAAIARLNELRAQRNAPQLTPGDYNVEEAYNEILAERRRELVAEGHRFFDLKRLGRDISKPLGRSPIPFNSPKILDDLPPDQLSVNEKLQQNPGYN